MSRQEIPTLGLRAAFGQFVRYDSPRLLLPVTACAVGARAVLGRWTRRDLAIAGGILAAQPFTEWSIHVLILHWKPRTVAGRRLDPLLARKHREHHADPTDPDLIFVPMPVLHRALPAAIAVWALTERQARTALTGAATSYSLLAAYEWTHFLIHSRYRPRRRLYSAVWRAHRLHHYRNEHYWFGVTMHLADRLLGTYPKRDTVPVSRTARTLGAASAAGQLADTVSGTG